MYSHFAVDEGVYVPRPPEQFPQDNAQAHLVEVKPQKGKGRQFRFDESYPYLDKSLGYRLQRNVIGPLFLWLVIYPLNRLRFGLKIEGRRQLKGWRKRLRQGAVAVCNHVYQFDAVCVKQALSPRRNIWIPMYAKHFNGGQYWFVRYVGGIPVPETRAGMRRFDEAFDEYHRRGDLILVFPEEVRWDWYKPLRPFRRGAFAMAYKYGVPIVPCTITFRPRKGIYRWFGKADTPLVTLRVGEPLMPDSGHPRRAEIDRLRSEAHQRMVQMAGISSNPWDAVPDDETMDKQHN